MWSQAVEECSFTASGFVMALQSSTGTFWMSELMTCSSLDGSVKSHLQPGRKQADSNAHTSPEWLLVPTFIWALPSHGLSSSTAIPKKTKGDKGEKRSSEKIKPQVLVKKKKKVVFFYLSLYVCLFSLSGNDRIFIWVMEDSSHLSLCFGLGSHHLR